MDEFVGQVVTPLSECDDGPAGVSLSKVAGLLRVEAGVAASGRRARAAVDVGDAEPLEEATALGGIV
jgi:hypothetical protein